MNPEIYRQYDDRWGDLPYPGWGAYLSDSGCGCLAVYHCAIELEKYAGSLTVPQCRDYMVQYATVDDGTLWSGITQGLEHYGFTAHWRESDTMDDIFRELKDSCNCGVILFAKKKAPSYGPDGTLWTTIGHYIAFSDYKIENGQHMFYMKDSGPRRHDGWFSYEKSMRGCCKNVWICKSTNGQKRYNPDDPHPQPEPTPRPDKYPGNYPVVKKYLEPGDRGENVIRLQQYLDWYYNGAFSKECGGADGVYGANTLRWVKKMQAEFFGAKEADGLVGPKTIAEMKKRGGYVEPTPTPTNYTNVIDVSDAQDDIDWAKVKADGIVGVMVRCGYRGYEAGVLKEDHMFMKHIKVAQAAGLKLGIYFFTQALNYKEGKEEADYAISLLNKAGVSLYYPIAVDTEHINAPKGDHPRANNISVSARTSGLKGFCDQITVRGYKAMIYACLNDLENNIDMSKLAYDVWCAQYNNTCQYKGKYVMWQYTSTGRVNGVKGNVDRDKCYITTASPKPTPTPAKPINSNKTGYTGAYPLVERTQLIIDMAVKLAWAKGTSSNVYKYPEGSAKKAFQNALDKVYPEHKNWGAAPSVGASCDVFVGTVIRAVGIDGKFPRGLEEQFPYKPNWAYRYTYTGIAPASKSKDGDIVMFEYDNGSHVVIRGNGMYYEANYNTYFGHTNTSLSRLKTKQNRTVILRPKNFLAKGDSGSEVIKLQKYLDWYFDGAFSKECGKPDGIFGNNTYKWTVKMQTDFFGAKEADGTVGPKTIAKMKAVVK